MIPGSESGGLLGRFLKFLRDLDTATGEEVG